MDSSNTQTRVGSHQACSYVSDSREATREVAERIEAATADLNFLFVSSKKDLREVARAWRDADAGPTIACTTAGEIWHGGGHVKDSVAGASLRGVRADVWSLPDLENFDLPDAERLHEQMRGFLDACQPHETVVAVVVLDGLSRSEERVVASIQHVLGAIPMVGGSAGDDLGFERTLVLGDGEFRENTGAIALIASEGRVQTFAGHHFEPTGEQVVVTSATPALRRVHELDGLPAAEVYRELTGLPADPLSPSATAVHPLMLLLGGHSYVRSLAGEVDGSLDLYCAIEEGVVLEIGRSTDMRQRLQDAVDGILAKVPEPELVLGFDCILRRVEMELDDGVEGIARILQPLRFFGFSTYGEVTRGLHVNQTLTGVAFGNR